MQVVQTTWIVSGDHAKCYEFCLDQNKHGKLNTCMGRDGKH